MWDNPGRHGTGIRSDGENLYGAQGVSVTSSNDFLSLKTSSVYLHEHRHSPVHSEAPPVFFDPLLRASLR